MTVLLYHGPTARETMLAKPASEGWFCPVKPFGLEDSLKVDEARAFVVASQSPPAVDRKVCLQIALDGAQDKTQDVLLKTFEEHDTNLVILASVLDTGTLTPTLRSRSHEIWCGGAEEMDENVLFTARQILQDLKKGQLAEALEPLRGKQAPAEILLDALTFCAQGNAVIWEALRPLYSYQRVSHLDLVGALLQCRSNTNRS